MSLIGQPDQLIERTADVTDLLSDGLDQRLDDDMSTPSDMVLEDVDSGAPLGCETYASFPRSVTLDEHALPEASGLTISGINPLILWSHNDSGSMSEVIAVHVEGTVLGSILLPDIAEDLEDIDEAPCPHRAGRCLWVGDIGDNTLRRQRLRLWITPEPSVDSSFDIVRVTNDHIPAHTLSIPLVLEGGSADIEALAVDHLGRRVWLFEKREEGRVQVWLIDFNVERISEGLEAWLSGAVSEPEPLSARKFTSFEAPGVAIPYGRMITSADLSPDGTRLLIRVYTGIYEYRLSEPYGLSDLDELTPIRIALGPLNEPQGEALSYGWRGEGVWSISESLDVAQPLNYFECQD